jgi:hypothetical protein
VSGCQQIITALIFYKTKISQNMKNLCLLIVTLFVMSIFISSCGSSPYKKRKACKGNGSWSGDRNLGYANPFQKTSKKIGTFYVRALDEDIALNS